MTKLAIIVEVLGAVLVSAGLGVEVCCDAHIGFVLITGGALVFSLGNLIWNKVLRL